MAEHSRLKTETADRLSELSEMAHLGRSSVINAGPMMLIWGIAIIVATLCEALSLGSAYTLGAWVGPIFVAFAASLFAIRAAHRDGRAVTWRSRAIFRVWAVTGAAIVVFNLGEELRRTGLQSESEAATALILSIAVMATGELASRKVLLYAGFGWLFVALGLFFVADGDAFQLVLGLAAVVLQILPGVFLMREKWKA